MAEPLRAPRGTLDVLPEDARRRIELLKLATDVFDLAGYGPFETPIFEPTELFARGVGETTDIVEKEMFTFEDQGGRSITLRPEGTAPVCRAYVEHGMHKLPQPVKLWYWGPFFRYEAPQAGRFRQFTQVGLEAIGSDDPSLDAESILLLSELLERAGTRGVRLRISSLGTPETRRAYSDELREHLRAREDLLSNDVRARLDRNPLRAFDSDHPGTQAALTDAPRLLDRLNSDDAEHFTQVCALLDAAGQTYEVDGTLVRGLDYYTRTVFEFESTELGAQSALGGGGRYDGLVEQLGGPATPGVGWAAGIERILLAAGPDETNLAGRAGLFPGEGVGEGAKRPKPERGTPGVAGARRTVYVATKDGAAAVQAFEITRELRIRGLRAELEQAGRSLKGQLKHADRLGADYVVIVGDGEVQVKDMASGEQRSAASAGEAIERIATGGSA